MGMSNNKDLKDVKKHEFTENDCKICMRNAERLLDDALNNDISIQTRTALMELSFEETAKSIFLFDYKRSDDHGQSLVGGNVEETLIKIFQSHRIKIEIMKNLLDDGSKKILTLDLNEYSSYIGGIIQDGMFGEKRDSRRIKISNERKIYSSEELSNSVKKMANDIIDTMSSQNIKYYNDLKNESLYVGLDSSTGLLQSPPVPKNKKIVGYIAFFIITQLIYQWDDFGEKKKVKNLLEKYKNHLGEYIQL